MRVWLISKAIYAQKSFSREGGLKAAARWHHKGHRIVYTSESLSLATLEFRVHIDPEEPLASYTATAAAWRWGAQRWYAGEAGAVTW